jgi:RNA polymerase sigma-70 factor, ECF subfamily
VRGGQPFALIGMAIRDDKITEIDILADPERLSQLDLTGLID